MLSNLNAMATIGVKNLTVAKKFYEETLGFKPIVLNQEAECVQFYQAGNSTIEVYESKFAGTNQATTATFIAGENVDREVEELKRKGVKFEHYENMPDTKLEGDLHVTGSLRVAWFKDPDGNILSLVNQ